MANVFNIPQLNPLKWYPQYFVFGNNDYIAANEAVFNPQYNNKHIDKAHYTDRLKRWITSEQYAKPYQVNDVISTQWLGLDVAASFYVISVLNDSGKVVKSTNSTTSGSWVISTGVKIFQNNMTLWDLPEGYYCLTIRKVGLFSDSDFFIVSEPIHIKEKHEDTVCIKYYHSSNEYGMFFDTPIMFTYRVHGWLTELATNSSFNVYDDQQKNLIMLGGNKYREWSLMIGGDSHHVPDYIFDQLDGVLLCDNLSIDGVKYTRPDGSKFEITKRNNTSLGYGKITMRESDSDNSLIIPSYNEMVLADMPTTNLFFVHSITTTSGTTNINKYFTSEARLLAYLNCEFSTCYTLLDNLAFFAVNTKGQIVMSTNNSVIAGIYASATLNGILPYGIGVTATKNGSLDNIEFEVTNSVTATGNYAIIHQDQTLEIFSSFTTTFTDGDTITGTDTLYLFFDTAESLIVTNSDAIITSIKGNLAPDCFYFELKDNVLQTIENNLFLSCQGALDTIDFQNSALTINAVHDALRYTYDALNNGSLNTSGGSQINLSNGTSASPSSDYNFIISQIASQNWSVQTN